MYKVFKDGLSWCATREDFVDLQNSPAGFGDTPIAAMDALLREQGMTIEEARNTIKEHFRRDPDWKRTYVDNIACCLEPYVSDHTVRNVLATHILDTIF